MSVDISLKDVDINQCDSQTSSGLEKTKEPGNKHATLNTFLGTHGCKASLVVRIIFQLLFREIDLFFINFILINFY